MRQTSKIKTSYLRTKHSLSHLVKNLKIEEATLDEIVAQLSDAYALSSEELTKRNTINEVLLNILKPYFPNCEVITYGGSAHGCGNHNSSIEILFIPHPNHISKLPSTTEPIKWVDFHKFVKVKDESMIIDSQKVPAPNDVINGIYPARKLIELEDEMKLFFIKKVISLHEDIFKMRNDVSQKAKPNEQVNVLNHRVVEFRHIGYETNCMLSIKNRLVLNNSELLDLYCKLDARVKPLMLSIVLWTKCLNIRVAIKLPTFVIQLLVIFFLQNTQPPVLPSVSFLHKLSNSSELIGGIQVAILKDPNKIPKSRNSQSLGDLFLQFFNFYWDFDFSRNIISTHIGKSYAIKEMKKNSFFNDFQYTIMCVQDPFQLKCNISCYVNNLLLLRFQHSLYIVLNHLNSLPKPNVNYGNFKKIFNPHFYKHSILKQMDVRFNTKTFSCILYYDHALREALGDSEEAKNAWFEKAPIAIFHLLKYGLLLDCDITNKMSYIRSPLTYKEGCKVTYTREGSDDVKDSLLPYELLLEIQGTVDVQSWSQRDARPDQAYLEENDFEETVLKNEYRISRYLAEHQPQRWQKTPRVRFMAQIFRSNLTQLNDLFACFIPLSEQGECKAFLRFLFSYLMKNVPLMFVLKK